MILTEEIEVEKLQPNTGQIPGLPKNPRFIKDERYVKLKQSIQDNPEMLELRECIVYPQNGHYVVIAGNMRYRACRELGYGRLPCKVLSDDTPAKKLRAYVIKDNIAFGAEDWDALANEWEEQELEEFGLEIKSLAKLEDDEIEIERSVQLQPPMEYVMIIADSDEFEELKEKLKLKMVRRGGYKKGSVFDDVGLERVLRWVDVKERLCI